MTDPAAAVDPFDLPSWLGDGAVTWVPDCGISRVALLPGRLCATGQEDLPCDLLAVDEAYPAPVADDDVRTLAHQSWRHGQVHLVSYAGRLTLAVPGTGVHRRPGPRGRWAAWRPPSAPRPSRSRRCSTSAATAAAPASLSTVTREIALLTNPAAGKGRATRVRDAALPRLRSAGFVVRSLVGRDADEALDLARQCVADGIEALVVCGGDGIAHLGVQAVAGTTTKLGVLPAGTGNDVARYLDIPLRDPLAAADRIIAGHTRTLDLARSGSKYYVTVLAAGFDAVVNERANRMTWPKGQMRYNLATLAELRTFKPLPYTLELDGRTLQLDAMLVAVGNGPSFGGGLRITEGALLDDGLLDVVIFRPMTKVALVRAYPRLFKGTHTTHPQYEHHRVARVTVAAPGIVAYADGERFGPLPLTVECVPGALTALS